MAKPSNVDYLLVGVKRLLNREEIKNSQLVSSMIQDAGEYIKELAEQGESEETILMTSVEAVSEMIEGLQELTLDSPEDMAAVEVALANLRQFKTAAQSKMR